TRSCSTRRGAGKSSSPARRPAASARSRSWRAPRCSSRRRRPASSMARSSSSTAASSPAAWTRSVRGAARRNFCRMSAWQRLLHLADASPFTGTWMSLGTTLGALLLLLVLRRLVPADERQQGSAPVVLLALGLLLGLVRLLFVFGGAHLSTAGRVIS